MKTVFLTMVTLLCSASVLQASTLAFEPYVDAQYNCLWIEGENTRIALNPDITSIEEAVKTSEQLVGKPLTITCNQDQYQCVHKDGDVEPRLIYRKSVIKDLYVTGGRIIDLATNKEAAQIGKHYFHQNLRRLPRCD